MTISRRRFLQRAALGGVLAGCPTLVPATVFGAESPSSKTTVASIGVGGRGGALLSGAAGLPHVREVGICDVFLVSSFDEVACRSVELKITGYYGASPAVRELGIYRRVADK
jgi:myo-inositol 2-dehydrogenase / D-chiro-inositol 1-dehydrogenase